jgi:HD-like signal output (HDOD) protein
MAAEARAKDAGTPNKDAFLFVQSMAAEASAGRIEIPSFPDVAIRIRRVLADENCDAGKVAKVAGAEPALAARLLQMANSVALNPNKVRVADLRGAIARIGFANVRSTSLAYAMGQIRNGAQLAPVRDALNEQWEHSVRVAALAYVAARSWSRVNPDRALLAGLMHRMGHVYILTRAVSHPALLADAQTYQHIVRDWHAQIAKLVLESWDMPADVIEAVEKFENPDREDDGEADPTDVLAVASLLAAHPDASPVLEAQLMGTAAARRLGLSMASVQKVLEESAAELAGLHAALGG